jgi:hypothetical protein
MVLSALAENDFKQQFQLLKQHFESFGSVANQVRVVKSFTIKTPRTKQKGQQKQQRNSDQQISHGLRNHPVYLILKGAS